MIIKKLFPTILIIKSSRLVFLKKYIIDIKQLIRIKN
jgi:hypothetical protein